MQTADKNDSCFISGRQMAEFAMQSGLVFSPLARQTPAGRGLWPQGFPPGIETGSRFGAARFQPRRRWRRNKQQQPRRVVWQATG